MRVKDFMVPKESVVWALEAATLEEAGRAMIEKRVSSLVVVRRSDDEANKGSLYPVGLFSKTDLIRAIVIDKQDVTSTIEKYLTYGIITVDENASRDEAAEMIHKHKVHHLAVVQGPQSELSGLISSWDIAREAALDAKAWPYSRDFHLSASTN